MNLLLFLSDRCNMACDYCFLSLNAGPAHVLTLDAAGRAVSDHLERHGAAARFTVLGGEPFLHYSLLKSIVARVAAESEGRAPIGVVTNGTLACPDKLRELARLGASVTVSLDGKTETHDRRRPLAGKPGASSLRESLHALEACDRAAIRVNMVVCEDTADSLLANVEFLRAAGFRRLSFHLNVLERWTARGLAVLEKSLDGLPRYREALARAGGRLELTNLDSFREPSAPGHSYDDVVLGADGRYYPCDGLFSRPYGELGRWTIGDALSGLDWARREEFHRTAADAIHEALGGQPHFSCPREAYFQCAAAEKDPASLLRDFARADAILGRALGALCEAGV